MAALKIPLPNFDNLVARYLAGESIEKISQGLPISREGLGKRFRKAGVPIRSVVVNKDPAAPDFPHGSTAGYVRGCHCENCIKAHRESSRMATQRWRKAHPEKKAEHNARARQWNQEHSERHRANVAAWREANPGKCAERARQWIRDNPERHLANVLRWRAANPEKARLIVARRRARKLAAETLAITDRDWSRLVDKYRGCCAYCGQRAVLTMDHVVPISRGGRHGIGNILPACKSCNSSKHDALLIEWRSRPTTPQTGLVTCHDAQPRSRTALPRTVR